MSAPLNTLTRGELARETVSTPISDDDYGHHPRRPAYPGVVLPDAHGEELTWRGSVSGHIRALEAEVARLMARIAELEARP